MYLVSNDSDLELSVCMAKNNKKIIYILPPIRKYSKQEIIDLKNSNRYIPRPS
jgi:hypothetical protein